MRQSVFRIVLLLTVLGLYAEQPFTRVEFPINSTVNKVLSEDWDGDGETDLLVMTDTTWYIYLQTDGDWNTKRADVVFSPPTDVIGYDFGNVDEQSDLELVYFTPNGVYALDLTAKKAIPQFLFKTASMFDMFYTPPKEESESFSGFEFTFLEQMVDSEAASILVPTMQGIDIFEKIGGTYQCSDSLKGVGSRSIMSSIKNLPKGICAIDPYKLIDFNGDGHRDFLFEYNDHLSLFLQNKPGRFSEKIDIPLPPLFRKKDSSEERPEIIKIEDIDRDGIPDIVATKMVSQSLFSYRTHIQTYFGRSNKPGGEPERSFPDAPDHVAVVEGITPAIFHSDLNRDGYPEMIVTHFQLGIVQIIKALVTSTIRFDLWVYVTNQNRRYKKLPDGKISVSMAFNLTSSKGNSAQASSILDLDEDFNGDGILDFIVQSDDDEFTITLGGGDQYFDRSGAIKYKIEEFEKGYHYSILDVNGDKRSDILLYPAGEDKVIILQSRI